MDERDHSVWKNDDDFMSSLCECLSDWGLDMIRDNEMHDLYDLWCAARRTTPDREAWQPIETAPKDGTQILGWCSNYGARQTHWHFYGECSIAKAQFDAGKGESGNWYWEEPLNHWLSSWKPTHWMPLPAAPTSDKGGA